MILKITKFLPAFVLISLTVFATAAFSINHTVDTAWKELESGFKHDVHSGVVTVGDPVPGGGTPNGANQTLNCTV
jgi:hypothetical protein